jgi:hypothetical protein
MLFEQLMCFEFSSIKSYLEKASELLNLKKSITSRSIDYWVIRGWDPATARYKAKQISKTMPSNSPYSISHWTKKINPTTNKNYTEDEAQFECNKRRPIKMEYWIDKGFSKEEAIKLAASNKEQNNKKGAHASANRNEALKKSSSVKSVDYWLLRGYSEQEAIEIISKSQVTFNYEKCIEKYGKTEGGKRWARRQEKWIKSLNSSGLKSGFSKISQELFAEISLVCPFILYGMNEKILTADENSYMIDCIHQDNKKIIEFYGDYWHANPKKFTEQHRIHKRSAKEVWERDNIKINDLRNLGYDVLVIWESEYKSNREATIKKCIQFLTT